MKPSLGVLPVLATIILLTSASSGPVRGLTTDGMGATIRASVASDATQGNGKSFESSISSDGRYVVFSSVATNLVSGDTNNTRDVFLHDMQTGQTTRVSVASDGSQGNRGSDSGVISGDGRYVAFSTDATNLVADDTNLVADVFIRDMQTDQTTRVSVSSDGSQGNNSSYSPSISADGRFVAFTSTASNLVFGDTNRLRDVFVHDMQTGQTTRVSVASDGTQGDAHTLGGSISASGRYVVFGSDGASNLVPGDTNGLQDVFVHDLQTGKTSRVAVASNGTLGNGNSNFGSISADGRYVAFTSQATNLVPGDTHIGADVFLHDMQTGQTTRVSVASDGTQGNESSFAGPISATGRYVAFESSASNLVPGDTNGSSDAFIHDMQAGETVRVSLASDGSEGNGNSGQSSISADARYVAFASYATNLVQSDTNAFQDVFVRDRGCESVACLYLPLTIQRGSAGW